MDGRFYLASVGCVAATRSRIVGAVDFDEFGFVVLHNASAGDEVAIAQSNLASGRKAIVLLRRIFADIILLDKEFARERDFALSGALILGIVHRVHLFDLAFGVVVDHYLQR